MTLPAILGIMDSNDVILKEIMKEPWPLINDLYLVWLVVVVIIILVVLVLVVLLNSFVVTIVVVYALLFVVFVDTNKGSISS